MGSAYRRVIEVSSFVIAMTITGFGWAEPAKLPPPPPGFAYVPLAYPPAPAGYRYVPQTYANASGMQAPLELPYEAGKPIPFGYHVREESRRGLLVGGYILAGIPYGISTLVATSKDFGNSTGYLLVPFIGPWLTMGRRNYSECTDGNEDASKVGCLKDSFILMGLIMDGILQAGGGAMLLTGYLAKRKKLVRNDVSWSLAPSRFATAYGFSAIGTF